MLNRRLFLSALLCAPATVFAAEDGFLGDILGGIADRALRDYVGQHFGDARWDGRYYNYDDHRYTRDEWRRYLEERYRWERNGGFRRVRDDEDWDDDDDAAVDRAVAETATIGTTIGMTTNPGTMTTIGTTMMTTMTTTVGAAAVRVGTGMTTMTMIDRFSCGREVESLPCAHVP